MLIFSGEWSMCEPIPEYKPTPEYEFTPEYSVYHTYTKL